MGRSISKTSLMGRMREALEALEVGGTAVFETAGHTNYQGIRCTLQVLKTNSPRMLDRRFSSWFNAGRTKFTVKRDA